MFLPIAHTHAHMHTQELSPSTDNKICKHTTTNQLYSQQTTVI